MTVLPQHMQALQTANVKRTKMAALKREIAALSSREGAALVADIVENDADDDVRGGVRIRPLLVSVTGIGDEMAGVCLRKAGVSYYEKRLRDLTDRQRAAVALQLRLWASTRRAS